LGIPKSLDEYLERLKELQQLNEKLKTRGQNEVEDAIKTQQELDNINMLLAQEAENHKRLQKEIEELKSFFFFLFLSFFLSFFFFFFFEYFSSFLKKINNINHLFFSFY